MALDGKICLLTSNCSNTIPFASILTVCRIGIVSKYLNLPTYAPFFLLYSLIMLAHLVDMKLFQRKVWYIQLLLGER